MNSITMNFDDNTDINALYNQLRKQYPKFEILKNDNPSIRAMKKMQELMADEAKKLRFRNEEDAIKWIYEARDEMRSEN